MDNCGSCGNTCSSSQTCNDGSCIPIRCSTGDCTSNSDCIALDNQYPTIYGTTCIPLKDPLICYCTKETNTILYSCETYRDWQIVDGVCYQQWECCQLLNPNVCIYQIRTDCQPVGDGDVSDSGPVASCTVSLLSSESFLQVGEQLSLEADVVPSDGTVSYVEFSSNNTDVLTVNPSSDTSSPYLITATAQSLGSVYITASVNMDGINRCLISKTISVINPGPWWQTRDADLSAGGNITSNIPSSATDTAFILNGSGGYPGIPSYSGLLDLGTYGSISSKLWSVNSLSSSRRFYNYSYFARQIPSDTEITTIETSLIDGSTFESGGTLSNGAYWYKFTGTDNSDLTISSDINVGTRKVVLLVDGADLYLNSKVNLTDGEGFFMAIVGKKEDDSKGNIIIGSSVGGTANNIPELEGLFSSDGLFKTGLGTTQLHIRGSVAVLGGITLERDLGDTDNTTTPAEYFEYAPDQVILMPSVLREKKFNWKEVAP